MTQLFLLLLVCLGVAEGESAVNWTAKYPPCNRHSELLSQEHMEIGVRLSTRNPVLAEQFRRALDSWSTVLDLDWHEDNTHNCSVELVDGKRSLFRPAAITARSQLPDRAKFQGWIAFNPRQRLSALELYRISLHEIGHMFGLQHSSNTVSVMYGFDLDSEEWLDATDLATLATHHKLRIGDLDKPVRLIDDGNRPPMATSRLSNDTSTQTVSVPAKGQ